MTFLFYISLFFVLISSFLLTLLFEQKKAVKFISIFSLIVFSQIVLTIEFLSLFSAINIKNILISNGLFFVISILLWLKNKQKPQFIPNIKQEFSKIIDLTYMHKFLLIMGIGFLFTVLFNLFYAIFIPIINPDAGAYSLVRLPFWLEAGNLNHFIFAEHRVLVMPINTEILELWLFAFFKQYGMFRLLSVVSFIVSLPLLYEIGGILKLPRQSRLFGIYILFSMMSVNVRIPSYDGLMIMTSLILMFIYLFWYGLKENNRTLLFFSTLAFALSVGVKTTAFFIAPFLLLFVWVSFKTLKIQKQEIKNILIFCFCMFLLNFAIFSSYNYIENFIWFQNIMGNTSTIESHRFYGGFKAFLLNLFKYGYGMIDFSGFTFGKYFYGYSLAIRDVIQEFYNIDLNLGVLSDEASYRPFNNQWDVTIGPGIFCILLFIPSLICMLKKYSSMSNGIKLLRLSFAIGFIMSMLVMSFGLGYMVFNVRFTAIYIMISAPVLMMSYELLDSKYLKYGISLMAFYLLTSAPMNFEQYHIQRVIPVLKNSPTVKDFKDTYMCSRRDAIYKVEPACAMEDYFNAQPKEKIKILAFVRSGYTSAYKLKTIENDKITIDFGLPEIFDFAKLKDYDYIIKDGDEFHVSSVMFNYDKYKEKHREYVKGKKQNDNKLLFQMDNGAMCYYTGGKSKVAFYNSLDVPVAAVKCIIPPEIFQKYGFKPIQDFPFIFGIRDEITVFEKEN